ncbi:MAG: ABC-2 family transporter protein [Clostridia bacterium]
MKKYLVIYFKRQGYNIATELQYRANFISTLITVFAQPITMILSFYIITSQFETFAGWTFFQMSFIYGIWRLGHSISISFFQQGWDIGNFVRNGEFDKYLVKPLDPLFQLFCIRYQKIGFPHFISGIVIVAFCSVKLNLTFSVLDVVFLIITVLSAAIIEMSATLLFSSFSFWITDASNILRVALNTNYELMQYPINIYNDVLKGVLTFILPYGFMSFYPSYHFITNGDELSNIFIYGSPVVALIIAIVARSVFMLGIKHYNSTGT